MLNNSSGMWATCGKTCKILFILNPHFNSNLPIKLSVIMSFIISLSFLNFDSIDYSINCTYSCLMLANVSGKDPIVHTSCSFISFMEFNVDLSTQ